MRKTGNMKCKPGLYRRYRDCNVGHQVIEMGLRGSYSCCYNFMSFSLNSSKGVIWGSSLGVIEGDTRSLDYKSTQILVF